MNKSLSLLTMCRKAGKLVLGMDPVKDACRNFTAKGVLVSADISPKSLKEALFVSSQVHIPVYELDANMEEIWASLGKKVVVLGVCDLGFKKKLSTMLKPVIQEIKE